MSAEPVTPSKKQLREFGLLIGCLFPLLLGWLLPALRHHPFGLWTLWISLPALVLAIAWPRGLLWPYRGWMALGHFLGWINSHLVLGAVFLLVLQPLAMAMKLFGHDPLRRRRAAETESYREPRPRLGSNMKRMF